MEGAWGVNWGGESVSCGGDGTHETGDSGAAVLMLIKVAWMHKGAIEDVWGRASRSRHRIGRMIRGGCRSEGRRRIS